MSEYQQYQEAGADDEFLEDEMVISSNKDHYIPYRNTECAQCIFVAVVKILF